MNANDIQVMIETVKNTHGAKRGKQDDAQGDKFEREKRFVFGLIDDVFGHLPSRFVCKIKKLLICQPHARNALSKTRVIMVHHKHGMTVTKPFITG